MSWFTAELRRHTDTFDDTSLDITTGVDKFTENANNALQGTASWLFLSENSAVQQALKGSTNLFGNVREGVQSTFDRASGYGSSFEQHFRTDQWRDKLHMTGTPNLPQPSFRGATSPNLSWMDDSVGKVFHKAESFVTYVGETLGHTLDFIKDPADKLVKNQGGLGDGGSGSGDGSAETAYTVKGAGTLKGREATLQLNKGAKGLGRSTLRIGTGGTGTAKSRRYKQWLSGRYTAR